MLYFYSLYANDTHGNGNLHIVNTFNDNNDHFYDRGVGGPGTKYANFPHKISLKGS